MMNFEYVFKNFEKICELMSSPLLVKEVRYLNMSCGACVRGWSGHVVGRLNNPFFNGFFLFVFFIMCFSSL